LYLCIAATGSLESKSIEFEEAAKTFNSKRFSLGLLYSRVLISRVEDEALLRNKGLVQTCHTLPLERDQNYVYMYKRMVEIQIFFPWLIKG
jgi:hypothetical protein